MSYEPDSFNHGIDVLREAVADGEHSLRGNVLRIMAADMELERGTAASALYEYVHTLSRISELRGDRPMGDELDFDKLMRLHIKQMESWASSEHTLRLKLERQPAEAAQLLRKPFTTPKGYTVTKLGEFDALVKLYDEQAKDEKKRKEWGVYANGRQQRIQQFFEQQVGVDISTDRIKDSLERLKAKEKAKTS
jgi:hypothetical protein